MAICPTLIREMDMYFLWGLLFLALERLRRTVVFTLRIRGDLAFEVFLAFLPFFLPYNLANFFLQAFCLAVAIPPY
jgi:hypothetical protein